MTELITHKPYIKVYLIWILIFSDCNTFSLTFFILKLFQCGDSYEVALDILREMFGSQRDPMLWNPTDAIRVSIGVL